MTQINYSTMSDQDLKRYLLNHRDDREAFYAYMDRRHSRSPKMIVPFDDPQWEEKMRAVIRAQLDSNN